MKSDTLGVFDRLQMDVDPIEFTDMPLEVIGRVATFLDPVSLSMYVIPWTIPEFDVNCSYSIIGSLYTAIIVILALHLSCFTVSKQKLDLCGLFTNDVFLDRAIPLTHQFFLI